MKSDIDKIYLIDRFLKGELSGLTLDEFKNRMRTNKDFALEVESQKAIIEGIKLARRQHLISILKGEKMAAVPVIQEKIAITSEKVKEYKPNSIVTEDENEANEYKLTPNYNNWYWAAAAVLFTLFTLYFIFGYYLPRQTNEYVNTDTTQSNITKIEKIKITPENENEDSIDLAVNPFTNDTMDKVASDQKPETLLPDDSLQIEKDKKISERIYSVAALESINPIGTKGGNTNVSSGSPDSLKVNTIKKVRGSSVKVEYWQSVVNFKGYKLSRINLQLYDIKPDENISLKYLDKVLYMKKNGTFYKLKASGNFESYQKEGNGDIIKILETK